MNEKINQQQEKKEDLEIVQKKLIIDKILLGLSKNNSELYYTDSSTISHIIKEQIEEKKINNNDYEKVKDLSASDILVLMSYHSNCC